MRKSILALALTALMSANAFAQSEVLNLTFNDGTSQSFDINAIKELTFTDSDASITDAYTGTFGGQIALTIGGAFTYTADIDVTVMAEGETLTIHYPGYSLAGTMMGDLTLGELTIEGLEWDEEKGGFYRNYGGQGLTRHFKAEQGGATTMDADYPLNDPSTILVTVADDGSLHIEDPFKLGAMPLPLTSAFTGTKK